MPNFLVIEGTILPENSVSSSCSLEKKACSPQLSRYEEFCYPQELEVASEALATERKHALFWKGRVISTMLTSERILSISFHPYDRCTSTILFIQNEEMETTPKGFVAPYLSEEEAEGWGAERFCESFIINDQAQLEFVEGLDEEIRVILMYFLRDATTSALALTYHEEGQAPGVYITHSWLKG